MSAGQININIPADSHQWLFADPNDRRPTAGRLWSLGRFPPKCKAGDDILFRFNGHAVAAAKVHEVYKPGLFDTISHNGARHLRGYKVTWLNRTFIDLRVFSKCDFLFACNDWYADCTGKFSHASLDLSKNSDTIELEGGEISIGQTAARLRIGRHRYAYSSYKNAAGNMRWDRYTVDLLTATAILNQLLDADFGITCGPTVLYDKAESKASIHWRDLLASAEGAS